MKRAFFSFFLVLLLALGTRAASICPALASPTPKAAYDVLKRVAGDTGNFRFFYAPSNDTNLFDTFSYEASNGIVTVHGENDLAICRGAYEYLKKYAHVMLTWSERKITLPKVLPDCPATKGGSLNKFRLYYNVCVFGYTTPYWNWERWQEEIDWMALHGINMPLAMNGQEAVWQSVWQKRGVSQKGIDELFCGPAYAPWQRMGNINNHNGPQPQEYMQKAVVLQKQCLSRMQELGMSPVVPGFSGFVPREFAERENSKDIHKSGGWAGFRDDQKSYWLSPKTELFKDIAVQMVREYTNFYGPQKYFLIDSFNEMAVPITGDKNEDLREYGHKSYEALTAGISDAVWLMQGWMFNYSRNFWTSESTAAFLSEVPDDRMIIIDLGVERYKGYKEHKAFYGKQWILSYIHNFGGYDGMFGNVPRIQDLFFEAVNSPDKGKMVGIGYSPEGVCQNEIVYEMMTDASFLQKPVKIEQWLDEFLTARYGASSTEVFKAWQTIFKCLYSGGGGGHFRYQVIPQLATDIYGVDPKLVKATEDLLAQSNAFYASESYWDDIVELENHILSTLAGNCVAISIIAKQMGEQEAAQTALDYFSALMSDLDTLNGTRQQFLLGDWTGLAAGWGESLETQKYYRMDARRLITVWGGHLDGYVAHHWCGLIGKYYKPRWEMFLNDYIKDVPMADIQKKVRAFEENWVCNGPDGPEFAKGNLPEIAAGVMNTSKGIVNYCDFIGKEMVKRDRGVFLGTWNASKKQILKNVHFLVSSNVTKPGTYQVLVKGGGYKRPCKIAIAMNGEPVAYGKPLPIDKNRREEARYEIELKEHVPGASYTVEIYFEPPVDGNGAEIWLK